MGSKIAVAAIFLFLSLTRNASAQIGMQEIAGHFVANKGGEFAFTWDADDESLIFYQGHVDVNANEEETSSGVCLMFGSFDLIIPLDQSVGSSVSCIAGSAKIISVNNYFETLQGSRIFVNEIDVIRNLEVSVNGKNYMRAGNLENYRLFYSNALGLVGIQFDIADKGSLFVKELE